jgi:hypothetical protein
MTLVPQRRESETREQASLTLVGLLHVISKPLNGHHLTEIAWEILPQRAPQIEQHTKQQMTSPWRDIQAAEQATLPTRLLARNARKQACFGYDGTPQGGGYVMQMTRMPYAELNKRLASAMKEIKEATVVQGFVNMVYCHLGFTAPTIYKAMTKDPDIISYNA